MQNHRKRKRTKKRSNRTPTPVQNRLLGGDTKVTGTVSGNAEVFQDMAEEDISEESSDELFNISSVDEGTSTDEDDSSKKRKISNDGGASSGQSNAEKQKKYGGGVGENAKHDEDEEKMEEATGEEKNDGINAKHLVREGDQPGSEQGDEEDANLSEELLHSPKLPAKQGVKRRSNSCDGRIQGCVFFHSTPLRPGHDLTNVTFKDDMELVNKIIDIKRNKKNSRLTMGVQPGKTKVENRPEPMDVEVADERAGVISETGVMIR